MGLGAGGASRLGLASGGSEADARRVVLRALELGVNLVDTADNYGTEYLVGQAISGRRDDVVLSTKAYTRHGKRDGGLISRTELRRALEASLTELRTGHVDIYHLHGVLPADYDYCVAELYPELLRLRSEGLLRFIAMSEATSRDPEHQTLARACQDGLWDVVMVGFNLFNQSARLSVFPHAARAGTGVELMTVARTQFSRHDLLVREIERLRSIGRLAAEVNPYDVASAYLETGAASELSYRFALNEPDVSTILVGTGSIAHLEENARAFAAGPLPPGAYTQIAATYGHLVETVHVPGRATSPRIEGG
jgi:L-galactose dehydrogenase